VYAYAEELTEDPSTASLKLAQDTSRGYYLTCKAAEEGNLPPNFLIHRTRKGQKIQGLTSELSSMNQQFKESLTKIMELTQRAVGKVIVAVREEMGILYSISDSIAILDMLMSFATQVTCAETAWNKPELTHDNPIVISKGRHPQMEALQPQTFQPNDTFLRKGQNFTLVTGANMAGKSTYLRQTGLITILGHIGSYVPADFCQLRLTDKILTRLGSEGGIADVNASGFYSEMQDTSYILENVTDSSLVLIDELCRGTSNTEGAAIAFAVAENLADTDAFTLFTTHHQELMALESILLNVCTSCFVVGDSIPGDLKHTHKLESGFSIQPGFGIRVAETVGIPHDVIQKAEAIRDTLVAHNEATAPATHQEHDSRSLTHELATILLSIARNSTLPETDMREYLRNLKGRYGIAALA